MACMDHECFDCGAMWSNNDSGGDCPRCESDNVLHVFDEEVQGMNEWDEGEEDDDGQD